MSEGVLDPKVIEPAGFDAEAVWSECQKAMEHLQHPDGSTNWRAAFSADPGVCSCPVCDTTYWNFGDIQECVKCDFRYPTDWWPMYSWGVQAGRSHADGFLLSRFNAERMRHPYYRYGYENPVEDAWANKNKPDWRRIMKS